MGDCRFFRFDLSPDSVADNNTAVSNTFAITYHTFASDSGYVSDATGSASFDLGNKFTLTVKDKIESVSAGWGKTPVNPCASTFQLVIYALAADGVLNTTPLYTSGTLLRPDNAIMPPNGRPATFETYAVDVDSLPAGDYIFAVRSAVDNIGIGTYYGICASEVKWSFTTVSRLTAKTFLPDNNAADVGVDSILSVTFDRNISDGNLFEGITIKMNSAPDVSVADISVPYRGQY